MDDKLIAKFQGTWAQRDSMYETVIYAHMKTFRFTGTPALYIECDIRMCHGSCPVIFININIQNINQRNININILPLTQTQPCNWREGKHSHSAKVRRKRSLANITTIAHPDMEDQQEEQEDLGQEEVEINDNNNNSSFSESLRLFQSLQVLANEDDGEALRNETTSSKYDGSHQSRPDFTSISRGPRGRG